MKKVLLIIQLLALILTGCSGNNVTLKEVASNFNQSNLLTDIDEVIIEEELNDKQFLAFYLSTEKYIVNFCATKDSDGQWYLSKGKEKLNTENAAIEVYDYDLGFTRRLGYFPRNEEINADKYSCVVYGVITDPEITRVMVGHEFPSEEFSEATIKTFKLDEETIKIYYYASKDDYVKDMGSYTTGFVPTITCYDEDDEFVVEIKNSEGSTIIKRRID